VRTSGQLDFCFAICCSYFLKHTVPSLPNNILINDINRSQSYQPLPV
jgi:hypothetical protein